jgi:hypothetical protein
MMFTKSLALMPCLADALPKGPEPVSQHTSVQIFFSSDVLNIEKLLIYFFFKMARQPVTGVMIGRYILLTSPTCSVI